MADKKEVNKIEVYRELTKYQNTEDVPTDDICKKFNLSLDQLNGLLGSVKRHPTAFKEMLKAGYAPEQIPKWFRREEEEEKPHDTRVPETPPQPQIPPKIETPPQGDKPKDEKPPEEIKEEPQGIVKPKPLVSGQLVRLKDGSYMRAYIEDGVLKIEPLENAVEEDIDKEGGAVSQMVAKTIESKIHPVVKKVAFNPAAYQYYAWLIAQTDENGEPLFSGDFGNFVNLCINFTMRVGFDIKLTITRMPGSALDLS